MNFTNDETMRTQNIIRTASLPFFLWSGLTPGLIAVLHKQLGSNDILTSDEILEKWLQLALPKEQFDELLRLGGFKDKVKVCCFPMRVEGSVLIVAYNMCACACVCVCECVWM